MEFVWRNGLCATESQFVSLRVYTNPVALFMRSSHLELRLYQMLSLPRRDLEISGCCFMQTLKVTLQRLQRVMMTTRTLGFVDTAGKLLRSNHPNERHRRWSKRFSTAVANLTESSVPDPWARSVASDLYRKAAALQLSGVAQIK